MKIYICKDDQEFSKKAFQELKKTLVEKPDAVLGLATGSSPEGLYQQMIVDHQSNGTSYRDVITYNLDEYVGIDSMHPQSYRTFMYEHLFDHIDILKENIHIPCGSTQKEADMYEDGLKHTTIDVQVLGIGQNGHIGFNEPGTSFDQLTHLVDLTENTRRANSRFFNDNIDAVPKQAISMGIATIMRSKKIIVLARGENKAKAVQAMIEGSVTEEIPASVLQNHEDVIVFLDQEAASCLTM